MQTRTLKNKSKRVQKKLYLGDFAMLGFEISAKFANEDESEIDTLIDDLMEFTETKNMGFGGGYTIKSVDGFISSSVLYNSPSEDDRLALEKWLRKQANLTDVEVGNFIDANYID
jgi:uncharacterized protein